MSTALVIVCILRISQKMPAEDLVLSLWCYLEAVEPLGDGAYWEQVGMLEVCLALKSGTRPRSWLSVS